MAIVPNVTVTGQFPFPATVKGSGPVIIGKVNGVWTVAITIAQLAPLIPGYDPTTKLILIWDQVTASFVQTTLQGIAAPPIAQRTVIAAGNVIVAAADRDILMNKTVGAPTTIILPTAASRNGVPVLVKDYKGDANVNNITFVAAGVETIDGFSNAAAAANGAALITVNYGRKEMRPLAVGGGWYVA